MKSTSFKFTRKTITIDGSSSQSGSKTVHQANAAYYILSTTYICSLSITWHNLDPIERPDYMCYLLFSAGYWEKWGVAGDVSSSICNIRYRLPFHVLVCFRFLENISPSFSYTYSKHARPHWRKWSLIYVSRNIMFGILCNWMIHSLATLSSGLIFWG